jgi:HEAT repeat protein
MTIIEQLKERLNSDDGQTRNDAALEIMDTKPKNGLSLLIPAVLTPKNERNYGTLVYAMSAFNCGSHIDTIIELMRRDNFEVYTTAADILLDQWSEFSQLTKQDVLTKINEIISIAHCDDEASFFRSIKKELAKKKV